MSTLSEKTAEEHVWKNIPLFMLIALMMYTIPSSPFTFALIIVVIMFNIRLCID
jgi:hypothetical protein